MKIRYITTDLDFESQEDLSLIIREMGDRALPSHNDWVGKKYFVVLASLADHNEPEITISEFCDLIEGLSNTSRELWKACSKRIVDIAFESGEYPNNLSCNLSKRLLARLNNLEISITITIYPIGHYSQKPTGKQ